MAITPSGKSFLVNTINDMLSIDTSSLLVGDICLVSFEPNYNGTTKIFIYDATRPSSGYGDWHIYRNANITRCIANQTARDYDDNVLFDGMKNGEIVINPNKNTLFYKDIIGQKVYEIAGADSVSAFLPRVFYGFKILGGVAIFDNENYTIKENQLLLCTSSDQTLAFNKGTIYKIGTETNEPTSEMLTEFLPPYDMVGKMLMLARDFENYKQGLYTANAEQTDLINYADTIAPAKLTELQENLKIVGFVNKNDTTLSWNDTNRTATLNIDNATQIYINGKLYDLPIGIFTKQISNVEGQHYIYFDVDANNNVIIEETTSFTEDLITKYCIIAYCYFDATNSKAVLGLQDERHGMTMDCDTHLYLHNTIGTAYQSGLLPNVIADGDGSVDSHIQMAGASGIIEDEDLKHTIPSRASTDDITIIYRDGANGNWVEHSATNKIAISAGTGRASYNQNNLGVWQLTEIANNSFGICYAFVCPSIDNSKKWFIILGTDSYNNVNDAREAASILPDLGVLPFKEYKLVAGFIYQTSNSYANSVKTRIVSIDGTTSFIDFRTSTSVQNAPINASDIVNLQNQIDIINNPANKKKYYASPTGTSENSGNTEQDATNFATALTRAGNSGNQIVVLTGTYTDNFENANLNQTVTSGEQETGGLTNFTGVFENKNASSSNRYNGISFATFNHTGAGGCYLENSRVNTALNLTGTGFFQANNCDTQGGSFAGQISITSAITVQFIGSKSSIGFLNINNAAAKVGVADSKSVAPITLQNGILKIENATVYSAGAGLNAVNVTGGVFLAKNTEFRNGTDQALARINIGAGVIYDLTGCDYDKINSTISASAIPSTEVVYFSDWISSKHNVTNIIETTDNKPTVAGFYVFNGQPANGYPTGITVADLGRIFFFNGTTWTKILFFADAPISIFNSTNNKSYTKNGTNNWLQVGSGSGSGGFSVTADTTTTTLDLNNVTETGITNFSAVTSLTNGPTGIVPIAGKLLTVANYFSANGRQQDLLLNDNKYFRSYINSVWSSWQLIATVDTTPNSDIIDALATPPASPSNGDAYVMLASPTGAWSTFAQGTVATYNESTVSWVNTVPANGTAITFSNPVNLNSINSYYIAGQTYKYNSAWGSPVIAGLLWQLFVPSSQFQPYNSQSVALSLVSNVVTATCSQNHNLAVGYSVVISASPNTAFNETVTVTAIVSPTVFKYAKTLANATTTGTLKATTQLLPSGCTSALIPSTISFNIIIAVSSGSYGTGSFICKNDRSTPCYIAGIPVGKLESISLITNATPQWETVDKKYTVETIPNHSFTNALHQNKIIVNTGDNEYSWTLADGSDLKKVKDGKFLLNVIDANRVLVANGGNTITTFVPHNLAGDKAYSYGNWYNGGAGNLVDGGTLTVGYRATSNLLSYKNEYQIEWTPTNIFFPVIASTPVALQVEAYNKQFALIDGEKLNNVNNILSLTTSNTKIKISAKTKSVRGKFSGQTFAIRSEDEDFNAALIPVFGTGGLANSANCNPNLDPAIKNINSYGNGGSTINFILAINPAGTLFAIPAPTATPNSHFVDAIGNSAVMTEGQIGFELNPLKGYRNNGTAVELYDFILMGQVTWNGSVFSNLINYAFNRKTQYLSTAGLTSGTINHNLGTNSFSGEIELLCVTAVAGFTVGRRYSCMNVFNGGVWESAKPLSVKTSTTARFGIGNPNTMRDDGAFLEISSIMANFKVIVDLQANY